jgi:uncharacterized protein YbaP (TraB family)
MRIVAVAIAMLVAAGPCRAEGPPQNPPTGDWASIETVVVTAQAEGPAFWRVKKGDSEIWILGTVNALPWGFAWNRTHLAEIIDGARVVLAPPEARAGFFEGSWFLLTHRGLLSMPDGKKLEESLPPDLRTRFVAARTALNLDADHFADDPPVLAAWKLQANFDEKHKLGSDQPYRTVEKIAHDKHVPMRPVGIYEALSLLKEILRLPQDRQQACLEASVANVEARAVHAVPAAEAWAVGNIKQIKAHYTGQIFEQCAGATPSFAKLRSQSTDSYIAAIDEALAKPGKTVMIVDIGSLLRSTGVAEELHKEDVVIEGPAE